MAIIGGGITGCAAAHQLHRAACAGRVDRGGANRPRQHRRQHGAADAGARRRFRGSCRPLRRVRGAPGLGSQPAGCPELIRTLKRLPGAPAGRGASVYLLHAARGAGGRAEEGTGGATSEPGLPASGWTAAGLRRMAGFAASRRILTRGNAQVDPYAACMAFARAAQRAGAQLHEHSRARVVRQRGGGVEIEHRPGAHLCAVGGRSRRVTPHRSSSRWPGASGCPTPTLSRRRRWMRRAPRSASRDVLLWDTERPYHYCPLDARPSPLLRRARPAAQAEDDAATLDRRIRQD